MLCRRSTRRSLLALAFLYLSTIVLYWYSPDNTVHSSRLQQQKVVATTTQVTPISSSSSSSTTSSEMQNHHSQSHRPRVMAFYYNWYGNVTVDGDWYHWDQAVLDGAGKPVKSFSPPQTAGSLPLLLLSLPHSSHFTLGTSWWPALGLYSSNDRQLVQQQFRMMRDAGIEVVIVSWYPEGTADQKDDVFKSFQNRNIPLILAVAAECDMFVAFHIEPYKSRTPATVVRDFEYLEQTYGSHNSVFRWPGSRGLQMMVFVYDSYLSPPNEWRDALPGAAYAIGLCVEQKHMV
jgi:hypothetical protein